MVLVARGAISRASGGVRDEKTRHRECETRCATAVARGVREAAALPLPDVDGPQVTSNTRAVGAAPLPLWEGSRAAPTSVALAAVPSCAAWPPANTPGWSPR